MEFRVLGSLEVHAGGEPLALGGRKQRGVLALLLLHANQVVSTDRLIDELWGERPPRTVEAYIQNCISRLRRVLGREVIETRPPGYLLHVDPQDVDALRFEHAVEEASRLGPPERAAALREALEYWRGPPLADLVFEGSARIEVARLDELRLTALELRLDAELELGRHEAVLAEIDALARRQPGRERLRYLQMLALYRSGRQRDALRAYQEARLELIEQFGLEPGEDLRALERMILAHDPTLELARPPQDERFDPGRRKNVVALALELVLVGGPADETARARTASTLAEIALVIERHGGVIDELLPEGVTAVFGVPQAHDDDTMRALRTATEIRSGLPEGMSARFAVERGQIEPVTAARALLADGRSGDLLLGAAALRVVPRAVDVVPHVSGRCFRVIRFDPDAEPFVRHLETPLVGRRAELARLDTELEAAVHARAPRHLAVLGEAGIGKTRLVREFVVHARRTVPVLTGRCAAYGERDDLLALNDILTQVGPLDGVLAAEPDADRVLAQLQDLSLTERAEGLWALRRLIEAVAKEGPIVLVLEDIHASGPAFLDLVEYLVGWTEAALLVISLARPELLEQRPEWREVAIFLEPLTRSELEELAAALPGSDRLDAPELVAAVEAAEGNPLFLEQLLAAGADELLGSVPPTIDVLIESRLDRLPAEERQVLECAAVVGREFWRAAVEAAARGPEQARVPAALMALVRRRLIRPETAPLAGEEGFRFHHALIRDVAYSRIGDERRGRLHESVARSLEGREPELDDLVGYHLEQAAIVSGTPALTQEAGRRLGAAGLRALKRFDGVAGVDLLSRATTLLAGSRLELDWALATSIKFSGDAQRAETMLDDVAEKAAQAGDERIELRSRIEQVWTRLARGVLSVAAALELLDRARLVFEAEGDDLGLGRAWHLTAAVEGVYRLRYDQVGQAASRGARHYERTGFDGAALVLLAGSASRGSTPVSEAIERCEACLLQAPTPIWESFILPFLAAVEAMAGRFDEAREQLEEARVRRQEFSETVTSWSALAAEVELLAGEPERAEAILLRSCELLRAAGEHEWLATNSAILAEAQYRLGRFEDAAATSGAALGIAPLEHLTSRSVARRVHAKCLARLGRPDAAVELALEALRLLEDADVLDERGETLVACAEALSVSGAAAEAEQRWGEALAVFERKGNEVSAERVRKDLAAAV
jgi:DNA-binding SARP family transcriptional activator